MPMPYLPSCRICAGEALPLQLEPIVLCQLVSAASGRGTQARATPNASVTSTRVTVSNVRQPSCAHAARTARDWAIAAAVADCRKALRFMGSLLGKNGGGARPEAGRWPYRRDCPIAPRARDGRP